jgi:hypothetical protein
MYFLFSFSSSADMALVTELNRLDKQHSSELHMRIDTVLMLDRGLITNATLENSLEGTPSVNTELVFFATNHKLFAFYSLITNYLNQATMPDFRFLNYLPPAVQQGFVLRDASST